ncbi:MAG: hypothetical protein HUU11_09850 [Anaerolineales bacterium]|nr:hypothetical protein [Anaerolineales bacterium]
MTAAQYDQVIADLEEKGMGKPNGRLYHHAAAKPDGWFVMDVWQAPADLEAFATVLMPVLVKNGVTPPEPQIYRTHKVITS